MSNEEEAANDRRGGGIAGTRGLRNGGRATRNGVHTHLANIRLGCESEQSMCLIDIGERLHHITQLHTRVDAKRGKNVSRQHGLGTGEH
jgi:hypothetical protein